MDVSHFETCGAFLLNCGFLQTPPISFFGLRWTKVQSRIIKSLILQQQGVVDS